MQRMYVDNDGWLVPWRVSAEKSMATEEPMQSIREEIMGRNQRFTTYDPKTNPAFFFWAAGVRPPALNQEWKHFYEEREARRLPPIPAWLGEHPPIGTVFVPNGEILTYGELDLHFKADPRGRMYSSHMIEGLKWYRYSPDGQLLGTYDIGSRHHYGEGDWRDIYANWGALEAQLRAQGMPVSQWSSGGGYRAYVKYAERDPDEPDSFMFPQVEKIYGAYDYAGNPVDLDTKIPWRSSTGTRWMQEHITNYYAAQVRLGLTDPKAKSPWAGTDQGPVMAADPTPQLPPRVARKRAYYAAADGSIPPETTVIIKALDAPDNPYKDQYGPWDHWLLENFGMQNPKWNEIWQQQRQAQQDELKKAKAEKRMPNPEIMKDSGIPHDPNDPWKNITVYVDDNGFPIPHADWRRQQEERAYKTRSEWDYRLSPATQMRNIESSFTYESGGEMPPEMFEAMNKAAQSRLRPTAMPLPEWLLDKPSMAVIFVPNGDILTWGAAGLYVPNYWQLPDGERPKGDGWYRYSAAGEFLGKTTKEMSWMALYNPRATELSESGKAQGYEVDTNGGYLIWRRKGSADGAVVDAWDYDGNPVDLDKPLLRDPVYLRQYQWPEIQNQLKITQAQGN